MPCSIRRRLTPAAASAAWLGLASCTRIMVGRGSAYDLYLTRELKAAALLRTPTSPQVVDEFLAQRADVAAGVKQQLQADDYARMLARRRVVQRLVARRSVGIDAWLTPTVPMLPTPTADFRTVADVAAWNRRATRNTRPGNLFGQCGVSLPIQHLGATPPDSPAGVALPVGLQLCAGPGQDADLLGLACAVEDLLGRPPVPDMAALAVWCSVRHCVEHQTASLLAWRCCKSSRCKTASLRFAPSQTSKSIGFLKFHTASNIALENRFDPVRRAPRPPAVKSRSRH